MNEPEAVDTDTGNCRRAKTVEGALLSTYHQLLSQEMEELSKSSR
jgi:hypothetical protein